MNNKTIKILEMIEDEEILRKALLSQIDPKEFEVVVAKNGEDGLKLALQEHPDIILLDLLMPKMDGMTMLKKLREDEWGKTVPVIIMTVVKDDKRIAEALEFGAHDYLVKSDFSVKEIIQRVRDRLQKSE